MAGPIRIAILANASQAKRELNTVGGMFRSVGRVAAAGLAVAGVAAVKFGVDSVKAASVAEQSIGATRTVFGKFADDVIRMSDKAARQYGLSANDYRESTNLLGALLKNQGVAISDLAGQTDDLIGTAADLAATFGGKTSDAVNALSAAFRGEFEQMERYGVSIKASTVSTEAAGIAQRKYGKDLDDLSTKQQTALKRQATMNLIYDQSVDSVGAFRREAGTLAGQQQRLAALFENVKVKVGTLLLPVLTRLAEYASDNLIPALEDMVAWLETNKDEIGRTASQVKDALLPPLKTLRDIVTGLAGFLSGLPGPVKELGIQAGVAALLLPKFNAAIIATKNSVGGFVSTARNAETRTAALGTAMRNAAGVAGALALVQGAKRADTALGDLLTITGAVAAGFAVGGPWGAVAGFGVAALTDLADSLGIAKDKTKAFTNEQHGLRDAINQTTGAVTRQARENVRSNFLTDGVIESARILKISEKDLISSALGHAGAQKRVNTALDNATGAIKRLAREGKLTDGMFRRYTNAMDQVRMATGSTRSELKAGQREVRLFNSAFKDAGTSARNTAKDTEAAAGNLNRSLSKVGSTKTDGEWRRFFKGDLNKAKQDATLGGLVINKNLRETTGKARPDLHPFKTTLVSSLGDLAGVARSGGDNIGAGITSGAASGVRTRASAVASEAVSMVVNALSAARHAAKMKSPSKEAAKIGRGLADGVVVGMRRRQRKVKTEGQKLALAVLAGVVDGASGVGKAIAAITKAIDKNITGKHQERRQKALLKRYKDEFNALRRNAKAQDRVTDSLKRYRAAAADIARTVRETGNVTALGQQADGTVSVTSLINDLKDKVLAAQDFEAAIRNLKKMNLSQAVIDQLVAAGPEAGLATADAILSGQQGAVDDINKLTKELATAGVQVGNAAVGGIIRGLTADQRDLDRAARRIARTLTKAVRKALGIKSPSTVFKDIGDQVTKGLVIGLDETYVKRSAASLATTLEKGFGTPALEAYASQTAGSASQGQFQVRFTAEQVSQLQRGREVIADIDAARSQGVRARTF